MPTTTRSSRPISACRSVGRHGWALLRWEAFATTWDALVADVVQRREQDPEGYKAHPSTKFLKRFSDVVLNEVPDSPGHERY